MSVDLKCPNQQVWQSLRNVRNFKWPARGKDVKLFCHHHKDQRTTVSENQSLVASSSHGVSKPTINCHFQTNKLLGRYARKKPGFLFTISESTLRSELTLALKLGLVYKKWLQRKTPMLNMVEDLCIVYIHGIMNSVVFQLKSVCFRQEAETLIFRQDDLKRASNSAQK